MPFSTGSFTYDATDGIGADQGSVTITGQGGSTLTGTAAAEIFIGGTGDDIIVGQQNDVLFDGGSGNDTLQLNASFTSTNNGQIVNIDNVTLTAAAVLNLSNQTEGFIITGSGGIDSISGGSGADTIIGAQADSLFDGNGGTDTLSIGAAFDDVSDAQIQEIENILLTAAVTLNLGQQTEGFNITGSAGADTITGGLGADIITAGALNDNLTGGGGIDTFNVTSGTDTITDLGAGGADNIVVSGGATVNATATADWTATAATSNAGTASIKWQRL